MGIREEREKWEKDYLSPFACLSSASKGRERDITDCPIRNCFQRDVDRIIHSKSFRRLMHKTQVFLQAEGDHYRTRMTHTLEVARIAKTIARGLKLNEDLTAAIAMGHDLGHTPFGHAGETVLNRIIPEGFRHNEQSLRMVTMLENGGEGLNLTYEVRQGILSHTGGVKPETLEGQIVRTADRIAYINHDIDDAIRGGVLYPMDIPLDISQLLGFSHGDRINTLVMDMVESSQGKSEIFQSKEIGRAMNDLRTFMFEAVYRNPLAKGEESKAQDIVEALYVYYERNPEKLPDDFYAIAKKESVPRAVCDYIAGMTDKYAMEKYCEAYIPSAWSVK